MIDQLDSELKDWARGVSDRDLYQGAEAFIANCCSHHGRAANQVVFFGFSMGVDTDPDAVRVAHAFLEAYDAGLGHGEQAIFPNMAFKVKKGINRDPGDPNYELLRHALSVSSRRMNPTMINLDSELNAPYGLEASYMG